jgi:hypothetical protein
MRVEIQPRAHTGIPKEERNPGCGSYPTAMNRGIDEGRAVGRGHPKRVEPNDMDPDEKGS